MTDRSEKQIPIELRFCKRCTHHEQSHCSDAGYCSCGCSCYEPPDVVLPAKEAPTSKDVIQRLENWGVDDADSEELYALLADAARELRDTRAGLAAGNRVLQQERSAHETPALQGWQPIETAPKSPSDAGRDRHHVLVVYPGWKDGKPDPFVLMAYQDSLGWDTGVWRLHETPTHWMPLPAVPGSSVEPSEKCHRNGKWEGCWRVRCNLGKWCALSPENGTEQL